MPGLKLPRLGVPAINQNPQPPHVRTNPLNAAAGILSGNPLTPAQPTNATAPAPSPLSNPGQALKPKPPPPVKPGEFREPSYVGDPAHDPRDKTYYENVAKLKFADEQKYNESLREQGMADSAYNDAMQTAIRNRAMQQRELGENAIRGNLGASGWLDRNEALQTTAYTQDRSHAALTKEQEDQARAAARLALQEGYGIEAAGEMAAAAQRYAEHSASQAESEEPGPLGGGGAGKGGKGGQKQRAAIGKAMVVSRPPHSNPGVSSHRAVGPAPHYKAALGKARKAKK